MADVDEPLDEQPPLADARRRRLWPRRKRWQAVVVFLGIFISAAIIGWMSRDRIATNIIESQLSKYGVSAKYEITSIEPGKQVLSNVVIGDAEAPDLTIERVTVYLRYRFGTPVIGRIELVRPRIFGTLREGKLSFGALDPIVFAESEGPPGLPDIDLRLIDARGLIESDFGRIAFKAEGEGELDDGFEGILAVVAPQVATPECGVENATAYGTIKVARGKPAFDGPVRIRSLSCPGMDLRLAGLDAATNLSGDRNLAGLTATFGVDANGFSAGENRVRALAGEVKLDWRNEAIISKFDLALTQASGAGVTLDRAQADGAFRARESLSRSELELDLEGEGFGLASDMQQSLASYQDSTNGTLLSPLIAKMRQGLRSELPGGTVDAQLSLRRTGEIMSGIVQSARIRGASGSDLVSMSQVQFSSAGSGAPKLSGNFSTGGRDLPRIVGRMERSSRGEVVMRLRMAEYASGDSALSLPELVISQAPGGALGFAGQARATGAILGGEVRALSLPIDGNWSSARGLSLWRGCTDIRFDGIRLSSVALNRHGLKLCPASSRQAILRYDDAGLRVAAGIPALELSGDLAGTPLVLKSGAVGIAWPGAVTAKDIDVVLGPAGSSSEFSIPSLDATFGDTIGGQFADADVKLEAVPLDLSNLSGNWNYSGDILSIEDASFDLTDRQEAARFNRLVSQGASITLQDSVIEARALMRHPASRREVTRVAIRHDLTSGTGHADLFVDGLKFDQALQPDDLTENAKGVVALVNGIVTGQGRIDWNEAGVTSSGAFSSDELDFAAAFGPVEDASGTIVFDDLLALTTAPGQKLKIGAINPGVLVTDGELEFALRDGQFISVAGASWPFMGGTLIMRSVDLNLGVSEVRRYVFEIVGLDAAKFVENMDFENLSATGTFDGTVPIEFDTDGNGRIDGGVLVSRPPGGNLSYVGELTYEDLSPMANFAFDSLKSLDFQQMMVDMEGPLAGEIITRLRFDGISQGTGADRNFITKRLSKLPIQFRVNIRADFLELIQGLRGAFDPAFLRDPRELGLFTAVEGRLEARSTLGMPAIKPDDVETDEPTIQAQESETLP